MKSFIPTKRSGSFIKIILATLGLGIGANLFGQGALTPPGAPAPTMKTLDQIEPRAPLSSLPVTISASGSYYLTTNLTGFSGTNGITVAANDVTIDLNGFSLSGVSGALDGIFFQGYSRLTVKNGVIRNWTDGIWASGTGNNQFQNLVVVSNASLGIYTGSRAMIELCTADANTTGINVAGGSIVRNCVATRNNNGIVCGSDNSISNSIVITGCSFSQNSTGLGLSQNGIVEQNDFIKNSFSGISANGGANSIRNNHFSFNYNGYSANSSSFTNLIVNNSFTGNTNAAILGISASLPIGPLITSSAIATNTNPNANFSF